MAGVPLPGQELLLLPDPVDGVLNHVPLNDNPLPPQPNLVVETTKVCKNPSSLEDLCVRGYLKYLENEIVTYVSLTQSKSHLVKGVAKRMLQVIINYCNTPCLLYDSTIADPEGRHQQSTDGAGQLRAEGEDDISDPQR